MRKKIVQNSNNLNKHLEQKHSKQCLWTYKFIENILISFLLKLLKFHPITMYFILKLMVMRKFINIQ